jgi:putative glycosyltransferase (TIGR04348 family)
MKIAIVTPAAVGTRHGNRVTALRWARLLRRLGHQVTIRQTYEHDSSDVLIALHARRGSSAIHAWRRRQPARPVILALTGTDVYGDIQSDAAAKESLEIADRLVVLQPLAIDELPLHLRPKARVIYQSAPGPKAAIRPRRGHFEVCVLAHLRAVKDPFRTASAARLLPAESKVRVIHLGASLSTEMEEQAQKEMRENPRYQWLGDVPRTRALRILARSRLLVQTSLAEGGANVISEAIAAYVPVLASAIPGSIGILGRDHPGYFAVGDEKALAALLWRAENDTEFYEALKNRSRSLQPLVDPAREMASWEQLLHELPSGARDSHA